MARLLLGEHLGIRGAGGSIISLLGLVVLMHPPFLGGGHSDWGPKRLLGVLGGAASACFSSGAFIFIRFIGKAEPALVVAMYFHSATIVISVFPLLAGWPQAPMLPSPQSCALLLVIAATSFAGQLLLTRGFQLESASRAASINFTQVIYAYIFGVTLFSDRITWAGGGGSLLIAAGIMLVNSKGKAPQQSGATGPTPPADAAAAAALAGPDDGRSGVWAAGGASGGDQRVPLRDAGWADLGPGGGECDEEDGLKESSIAVRDAAGAGVGSLVSLHPTRLPSTGARGGRDDGTGGMGRHEGQTLIFGN